MGVRKYTGSLLSLHHKSLLGWFKVCSCRTTDYQVNSELVSIISLFGAGWCRQCKSFYLRLSLASFLCFHSHIRRSATVF